MGLDQMAYAKATVTSPDPTDIPFIWRKHAKLQQFMEALFVLKTGKASEQLNCSEVELVEDDLRVLKELIAADKLPVCPVGFFYGHQFQDEAA